MDYITNGYRATPQWFIDISAIKARAVDLLKDVAIYPESGIFFWKITANFTIMSQGRQRLEKAVLSRSEWCISRQRSWGVPIPVFYHNETGE
jgi:isoleucyl-tRNA synthetase